MTIKTTCHICGKKIFIKIPRRDAIRIISSYDNFSCNDCVPEDSRARNGIDESIYTECPHRLRKRIRQMIPTHLSKLYVDDIIGTAIGLAIAGFILFLIAIRL